MSEIEAVFLTPIDEKIRRHATLCSIGFIILLPFGTLVARYFRTFTAKWFWGHALIQFLISGPIIFAGWALGYQSTSTLVTGPHFSDPHEKVGLALLILYLVQLVLGVFIHYVKVPFPGGRPPQNYLHALLGIAIIALAFWQVHYGITNEWILGTGIAVPMSVLHAWEGVIVAFWVLYGLGMAFLPRQFKQESQARKSIAVEHSTDKEAA